jgi:thymidylate kinase
VRETKLILIEGLPGSGKSTLAQYLTRCLKAAAVDVRWWYEEERDHPVYVFHDRESLRQTVATLEQGEYAAVVDAALARWRRFAGMVANQQSVVLIDSCLFGYLTWSLFPFGVPVREIEAYVAEVLRIIAPADPCLIYLYQDDVAASLRRICDRRGAATEQRLMEQSTQSRYGRSHQLSGFAGMVEYWSAYRRLTDSMFGSFSFPRVAIETTAGDWPAYQRQALDFLGVRPREAPHSSRTALSRFTGSYDYALDGDAGSVDIALDETGLILKGMPEVWQDTPLRPLAADRFAIESLPFEVRFEPDAGGEIARFVVSGPELLGGLVPRYLQKRRS